MVSDDFSFPTIISRPAPNYVESISLWRVPSVVFTESCHEDDAEGAEDSSISKTEEDSQINSSRGTEESSTYKTEEEDCQRNSSKGGEDPSTFKTEEKDCQRNSNGGTEDSSTLKTEEELQGNSSLTVNYSKRSIDNEEDKMDMLWENFNDVELHRVSSLNKKKEIGKLLASEFNSDKTEGKVELSCVPGRSSGGTQLSARKPSLLLILKVLKKLFLLQNAHGHKRNTSIDLF